MLMMSFAAPCQQQNHAPLALTGMAPKTHHDTALLSARRVDRWRSVDPSSLKYEPKTFSTVEGACVYVKVKCAYWAARHPRTPVGPQSH